MATIKDPNSLSNSYECSMKHGDFHLEVDFDREVNLKYAMTQSSLNIITDSDGTRVSHILC